MVFSSLTFLYVFLPLTLLSYFIAPRFLKNTVLLVASLIFYAWGEPIYILIMLFSSLVDYSHGRLIEKFRCHRLLPKLFLWSSICINLGLLGFFKYSDFFLANLNILLGSNLRSPGLPLPIGISFYTFQTMSYTIDVYRNSVPVQRNLINFATYVTLFPQLIAGPIVRYSDVSREIDRREVTLEGFASGSWRFGIGLGKKVLFANSIGLLWDQIKPLSGWSVATAWLGVLAFGLQVYFDFSGYSDMASGMGCMLGFNFPENFRHPYVSQSISEFWRRWHMTLGSWFRDYVYFPLGGSRVSGLRYWRNLWLVWFLTGFWHGAEWNFILWGLYFGGLIALERLGLGRWLQRRWAPLRHAYVLFCLGVGWALFAVDDLTRLGPYLQSLLGLRQGGWLDATFLYHLRNNGLLLIILVLGATPLTRRLIRQAKLSPRLAPWLPRLQPAVLSLLICLVTACLVNDTYNPFLYFRF